MRFEWDKKKCLENIKKHGVDFADVPPAFEGFFLSALDDRVDYGEDRWIGIGQIRNLVIVVAYTERGEDIIRLISARKATKNEKGKYYEALEDQVG